MRTSTVHRKTKETDIKITLNLDGTGSVFTDTEIGFLDHMLNAFGRHGRFDLDIVARGDLEIDSHHTVEDTGIVLGQAIKEAIGDGRGITRFASISVPMDESVATVAIDCGGRGYLVYEGDFSDNPLGTIPGDMFEHFFFSLCINAGITGHLSFSGRNDHHKCEALFKAFGIALDKATKTDPDKTEIPSTKGVL